jgi:hypothetical protein
VNHSQATVLELQPYVTVDASRRDDRMLVLFAPMQVSEITRRVKALQRSEAKLGSIKISVLMPDGTLINSEASTATTALKEFTRKDQIVLDYAHWESTAETEINKTASASGRCSVLLNTTSHFPPKPSHQASTQSVTAPDSDRSRLSQLALSLGCEMYPIKDSADMPSEIPPTVQEMRRDPNVQPAVAGAPISLTGEEVTYAVGDAVNHIM